MHNAHCTLLAAIPWDFGSVKYPGALSKDGVRTDKEVRYGQGLRATEMC